ncbi:hypothetical protein HMPREF9441_00518 [Paraprevotella clara YIT 11840]|uniref:Uncharacterized protein n=1 Tax=Paraprevotella clara YIT 11840 TaxID=762968 RepID=G5SME2_9BACT|nr:hypothetical protein HMPREF9441_00518 [Paraprevotella clara YIT 11840]
MSGSLNKVQRKINLWRMAMSISAFYLYFCTIPKRNRPIKGFIHGFLYE